MDRAAIGTRLKEARNRSGFTQAQLAEKAGIGTTYISDIERSAKFPSLSLFVNIIDALGVSADYVLRGEIEAGKNCIYDAETAVGSRKPDRYLHTKA